MEKNPKNREVASESTKLADTELEMDENDLEQVSGGLIALLVPAAQKVREAANIQMCDGSVMPIAKK
jgi:bacteriocin-like protein